MNELNFKKGHLPLYFQFYLKLRQEIITGDRPAGSSVPTLDQLAKMTGISHGMIRKALNLLEMEGLISKRPRLGTIVEKQYNNTNWFQASSLPNLYKELHHYNIDFLSENLIKTPLRLKKYFISQEKVSEQDQIYDFKFLLISQKDNRRRNLTEFFVPPFYLKNLSTEELKASPFHTLLKRCEIKNLKQVLRPWFCEQNASELLKLPEGTPIFHRTLIPGRNKEHAFAVIEQLTTTSLVEREVEIQQITGSDRDSQNG